MKTLDFNEMKSVNGGQKADWCTGIAMLIDNGFDFGSVDSGSYVMYVYHTHC